MRRILHCNRLESIKTMHTALYVLPLDTRQTWHTLKETYKIINGHCPTYLWNLFTYASDVHSRVTRSTDHRLLYVRK